MRRFITLILLMGTAMVAKASPQHAAYRVTGSDVVAALAERSVSVAESQIAFLASVVASDLRPQLQVERMELVPDAGANGGSSIRARMACRKPGECLPFYVVVRCTDGDAAHGAVEQWQHAHSRAVRAGEPPTVRAGAQVKLVLNAEKTHIELPVICLENAVAGQRVRAASTDRKQIYVAEVVDATLLKGTF